MLDDQQVWRLLVFAVVLTISSAKATTLSGPVTWGSPDQPYGTRRPVTAADREAIQRYRSGRTPPVFSTTFTDPAGLQTDWNLIADDQAQLQSCRRPGNVEASSAGLRLKTLIATDCRARWSTGFIGSKAKYSYGFFEATMKIADIKGMNNAFWLFTDDQYEIDVVEAQYPNYDHIGLQNYNHIGLQRHTGMGWGAKFVDNLAFGFHDYGMLWTPTEIIFEVDGEPVAAVVTHHAIKGPAGILLSSALAYPGAPAHPEGHDMIVQSVRVFAYQK